MTQLDLFSTTTGAIKNLELFIQGDSDFDAELIRLYESGTVTSVTDQQKIRMHTDGYRITLQSKWATNLDALSTATSFLNCIGKEGDTSTNPGAYCVYANSASAGNESQLELHWVLQSAMAPSDNAAPTLGASTTGLARFATQLQTQFKQQSTFNGATTDYQYLEDTDFTASWYQPKYSAYYVNQMRFDVGTTITAWHFDGQTSTWHTATGTKIELANGASSLAAGVACLLGAASLAF